MCSCCTGVTAVRLEDTLGYLCEQGLSSHWKEELLEEVKVMMQCDTKMKSLVGQSRSCWQNNNNNTCGQQHDDTTTTTSVVFPPFYSECCLVPAVHGPSAMCHAHYVHHAYLKYSKIFKKIKSNQSYVSQVSLNNSNNKIQNIFLRPICIPKPSVRRMVPAVLDAFLFSLPTNIHFPHKHRRQAKIKQGFHSIAGFPNTCGAMNCTHMAIKAPSNKKWIQLCQQKGGPILLACRHFATQMCLCCCPVAWWKTRLCVCVWFSRYDITVETAVAKFLGQVWLVKYFHWKVMKVIRSSQG